MHNADAAIDEPQSFLHRALRWLAILAIGYGVVQCSTFVVFIAVREFPFRGWGTTRWWDKAMSLLYVALLVFLLVGGFGLLKWKSWGRKLLIAWSLLSIIVGLASAVAYIAVVTRGWGATTATTQVARQYEWVSMWATFAGWLENCALPLAFLWTLLQPEVKRLWARPSGRGGFDVIPMAGVAGAGGPAPEVAP